MENNLSMYDTLMKLLGQDAKWRDIRHLKTLVWMVVGLVESGLISLTEWSTYTDSRAKMAQSTVRRFSRWLTNERIEVNALYGAIVGAAIVEWETATCYLALDTSMLWDEYCLIRVSLVYRGRAVPLAWTVLKHGSATVNFDSYRPVLDAAQMLLPLKARIVLLADRGFADTGLMAYCDHFLGWEWRIRCKCSYLVYRSGKKATKIGDLQLKRGRARFLHGIRLTKERYGPVHLAIALTSDGKEAWYVVSSHPTSPDTFTEYGLRFDIEENFLDDKSNGFQLESSRLRNAAALNRLCFLLAVVTLFLVSQGTAVVHSQQRRFVDAHWFRGSSYLKIGWRWVKRARVKSWPLIQRLALSPLPDPEPARASKFPPASAASKLTFSYEKFYEFAT